MIPQTVFFHWISNINPFTCSLILFFCFVGNINVLSSVYKSFTFQFIIQANVSVDTFFFLRWVMAISFSFSLFQWSFSLMFLRNSVEKYLSLRGLEPTTSCVRHQDATTTPPRHMWEAKSLNWAQFMLQWFIRFPKFSEFKESSAPFRKNFNGSFQFDLIRYD